MVESLCDPKVGVIFNPKSLIDTLATLIGRYMSTNVMKDGLNFDRKLYSG